MKIKCVNNKDSYGDLTIGKIYYTLADDAVQDILTMPDRYLIFGDNKLQILSVPKYMFITVDEMRDELLNEILDEN